MPNSNIAQHYMNNPILTHLFQHRRYIWFNAWNELRYRYAGTAIGIFWNVIHPIIVILLYAIIFSWIFPERVGDGSYVLYLTAGLLAWRVFADTIQRGTHAYIEHAHYLKRLTIPSEVFIAKITLTYTFILYVYYFILMSVYLFIGEQVSWHVALLPVLLLLIQGLSFGLSLLLANLRTLFPDVGEILNAFLPLWLWTLPVIYPESILPEYLKKWLYFNPPYAFIRSIRNVVLNQELPARLDWVVMAVWLFFTLGLGTIANRKLQAEAREVI